MVGRVAALGVLGWEGGLQGPLGRKRPSPTFPAWPSTLCTLPLPSSPLLPPGVQQVPWDCEWGGPAGVEPSDGRRAALHLQRQPPGGEGGVQGVPAAGGSSASKLQALSLLLCRAVSPRLARRLQGLLSQPAVAHAPFAIWGRGGRRALRPHTPLRPCTTAPLPPLLGSSIRCHTSASPLAKAPTCCILPCCVLCATAGFNRELAACCVPAQDGGRTSDIGSAPHTTHRRG